MMGILSRIVSKVASAPMRAFGGLREPHPSVSEGWRKFVRALWLIIGLGLFALLQYAVATSIVKDLWYFLGMGILLIICLVLVIIRPLYALVAWFIVSPVANVLFPTSLQFASNNNFDLLALFAISVVLILRLLATKPKLGRLTWPEIILIAYTTIELVGSFIRNGVSPLDVTHFLTTNVQAVRVLCLPMAVYFVVKAAIRKP